MLDLKSEMAIFPENSDHLMNIKKSATAIISNYRLDNQHTEEGRPFFDKNIVIKAGLEASDKRDKFLKNCKDLHVYMKEHLLLLSKT